MCLFSLVAFEAVERLRRSASYFKRDTCFYLSHPSPSNWLECQDICFTKDNTNTEL